VSTFSTSASTRHRRPRRTDLGHRRPDKQHTHFFIYGNAAIERGSLVPDAQDGNYLEAARLRERDDRRRRELPDAGLAVQSRRQLRRSDDITGYEFYGKRLLNFSPHAFRPRRPVPGFFGQYHDQFDKPPRPTRANVFIDFRNLLTLRLFSNYSGLKVLDGEFLPFFGNSVYLGYKVNTNTPSYVQYTGGPYYHGTLDAWSYVSTLPVAPKVHSASRPTRTTTSRRTRARPVVPVARARGHRLAAQPQRLVRRGVRKITGPNLPNSYAVPDFTRSTRATSPPRSTSSPRRTSSTSSTATRTARRRRPPSI